MDVNVAAVPRREPNMEPFEVMTSESQERMLAIVTKANWPKVSLLCERYEIRATVIGVITESNGDGGVLRIRDGEDGPVLGEVPAASLADDAPLYKRPLGRPETLDAMLDDDPTWDEDVGDIGAEIGQLLLDPVWVYRQYDHQLFLNTVIGPGGDGALLRLGGPGLPKTKRGVALSTDSNPYLCTLDPRGGTATVVAEAALNIACVGATPKAIVNCLNFGNPEHEAVMWQLSESIDGLAEASLALDLPVIGGNVSLYNESGGIDIMPTPVIGVVGFVEQLEIAPPTLNWSDGTSIVLVGARCAHTEDEKMAFPLGATSWAVKVRKRRGGHPPIVDLVAHRKLCHFIAGLIVEEMCGVPPGRVAGIHDVSSGGLGVALAEMAVRSTLGATIFGAEHENGINDFREVFSEIPSRVLIATKVPEQVIEMAAQNDVPASVIGKVGGDALRIGTLCNVSIHVLRDKAAAPLEKVAMGVERGQA
jgi:phosphoribosylformylglycinamidine synthase